MKRILILLVAALGISIAANAQSRALGLRAGYGGELSYQHSFGSNFAEFDLGWFSRGFDIVGIYDFVIAGNGQVNLYAGPGAQLGFYNHYDGDARVNVGIAGQLGVEWNIHFSLSDKLDGRADPYLIKSSGLFKNTDCYSALKVTLTYSFMAKCRTCHNDDE